MVAQNKTHQMTIDEQEIRDERFCMLLVEMGNAVKAYELVYGVRAPRNAWAKARHLKDRIEELRAMHAANHCITVGHLLDELDEARSIALTTLIPQTAAAVGATMGKAKLLGMDKQILEHVGKDGSPLNIAVNFVKAANEDA